MDRGRIIGRGAQAEVYALPDGRALKLYHAGVSRDRVDAETRVGRAVYAAGIPSPAVFETVEDGGRLGIIFEQLTGGQLSDRLLVDPSAAGSVGELMADLHAAVHALTVPEVPLADLAGFTHQLMTAKLPQDVPDQDGLRAAAVTRVAKLPVGDRLCHLDFHLGNIIATPRGPVIIDWPDARLANPDADVARAVLLMETGPAFVPPSVAPRALVTEICANVRDAYLKRYRELRPISDETLNAWLLPLVLARFTEGHTQEHDILAAFVQSLRE